jgi:hypothetical protein
MAAVMINFIAKGSQETRSADMRHRAGSRPDIGCRCWPIEAEKWLRRIDLSHMREAGCAGE